MTADNQCAWFTSAGIEYTGKVHSIDEKKGTAKFEEPHPCSRCGGAGGSEKWAYTGFTCFECGGHGYKARTRTVTVYSASRYAKLKAARTRRAATLAAKRAQDAEAIAEIRQEAHARHVAAFEEAYPGFAARLHSFTDGNDFLADLYVKLTETCGWLTENQVAAAEKAIQRIEHARASQYVNASIGDRVTLTITVERVLMPETSGFDLIPPRWTYICRDAEGHAIIYRGRSEAMPLKGETAKLVATIKGFDVFRDTKQTSIMRPKRAK
jgi:hypothetical protein